MICEEKAKFNIPPLNTHSCYYVEPKGEFSTARQAAYLAGRAAGIAERESVRRNVKVH